ncbi:hypothetical protein N7447_006092 [Penicillium robsamsonii]|uniref:uncharacterized protein n=1 Tax=Penicillium robsamsonii TaxID=1792511 RepID=UPI002547C40D|nr:uncharacterized protein N7447_006092 [Penicillium robsamsonii]KAJ5823752.1 hypothetical protein N7447_006092 [Penicillium robsamsonii]
MGFNASSSPEEETPDRMSVDPTSVSPVLDHNLNPMDEADLPDVGAISLSSPESLSAGFDGSGEWATPRKKKKNASASDIDESDGPEEPAEPEEIPPDVEDPAAHISYFCLPKTLFVALSVFRGRPMPKSNVRKNEKLFRSASRATTPASSGNMPT